MKIKDVRAHVLEAELDQPFSWSLGWARTRTALLVEIETEGGRSAGARAMGRRAERCRGRGDEADADRRRCARERSPLGAALRRVSRSGQKGLPVQALSGIDIALWDSRASISACPCTV